MPGESKRELAVIVPAKDEAGRIKRVLQAVLDAKLPTEVIAVSDGSRDGTADVARSVPGVKVVELPTNKGKAAAMAAGVSATSARLLLFIDGDLEGLRGTHIDQLALPLLAGDCDMSVGVFRGGSKFSDAAMQVSPGLSGQRAMRREIFEAVPNTEDLGMGIEYTLNQIAKRRRLRVVHVILRGVSNAHKEQKLGWMKGVAARTKMFVEITEAMVANGQKRTRMRLKKRGQWKGKR